MNTGYKITSVKWIVYICNVWSSLRKMIGFPRSNDHLFWKFASLIMHLSQPSAVVHIKVWNRYYRYMTVRIFCSRQINTLHTVPHRSLIRQKYNLINHWQMPYPIFDIEQYPIKRLTFLRDHDCTHF